MDIEATAKRIAWKLNDQTDCHDPDCLIGDPHAVAEIIAATLREALGPPPIAGWDAQAELAELREQRDAALGAARLREAAQRLTQDRINELEAKLAALTAQEPTTGVEVDLDAIALGLNHLFNVFSDADQFLNHSENHRALVSGQWDKSSARYEQLTLVRKALPKALAAARTDIPALLAECRRLQGELADEIGHRDSHRKEWGKCQVQVRDLEAELAALRGTPSPFHAYCQHCHRSTRKEEYSSEETPKAGL